ncbi:MAG: nucleoside phosphorylase [Bacteroidia bacterium]|nr:nucleoside phosphorylase [Bacteroidia bacterium]
MKTFEESELILAQQNRLYHINLNNDEIADTVIVVGDQNRVASISKYFSKIESKSEHREFVAHTGYYNNKRLTVLSTGIGTDNIDIVLTELDAAVNIDPVSRTIKEKKRQLNIIRLGTSGALQPNIQVNDIVVSTHGLGLDGLLNFYHIEEKIYHHDISKLFIQHTNWPSTLPYPYCVSGSDILIEKFKEVKNIHFGITATAPGFYGPQGRQLRLMSAIPDLNEKLTSFDFSGLKITNFEMETSALYGLGKALGHQCVTVCVIIANRIIKQFTKNYQESVEKLILTSLEKLT